MKAMYIEYRIMTHGRFFIVVVISICTLNKKFAKPNKNLLHT